MAINYEKVITLGNLKVFLEQLEAKGMSPIPYEITKNGNKIQLINADTKVVLSEADDDNTTYLFTLDGKTLIITGTDGTSLNVPLGDSITKKAITDALGFTPMESYTETDPTVPSHVKNITQANITSWNNKSDFSGSYNDLEDKPNIPNVPAWALAANKPSYTADEVNALANTVTHLSGDIALSEKGSANGVAQLDENGLVPSSQLPSYVDDVLEYSSKTSFPAQGETGKIYVATNVNKTYRWSGSTYTEISPSIALGETSSTAYAGDKGKANADAIEELQTTVGNLPTSYAPVDAQANVIETIKVNGVTQTITNKSVNISAVPTSRTVNGKALSSNITLSASDVNALPNTTVIPEILYGSAEPTSVQGKDGDIYIRIL